MRKLLKNMRAHPALLWLTAANIISNGATFVILLFVSTVVTPDAFGKLSISISVLLQISLLLDLGTGLALVRGYTVAGDADLSRRYVTAACWIRFATTLTFLLLALLALFVAGEQIARQMDAAIVHAVIAAIFIITWWNLVRSLNQARQDFRRYTGALLALATFRVVGVVVLVVDTDTRVAVDQVIWTLYVIAPLAASLLVTISELQWRWPRQRMQRWHWQVPNQQVAAELLRYGRWIFLSALLFPLSTHIPLWVLGVTSNLEAAGSFGIGLYFANAIAPVREAIRVYLLPKVIAFNDPVSVAHYVDRILRGMVAVLPVSLVLGLVAVLIQSVINGTRYDHSALVILIMIAVQVATLFTGLIGNTLHHFGQPEYDVMVNAIRVVTALLLSWLLVPGHGAVAAALVVAFTTLMGEYLIVRRVRILVASGQAAKRMA